VSCSCFGDRKGGYHLFLFAILSPFWFLSGKFGILLVIIKIKSLGGG